MLYNFARLDYIDVVIKHKEILRYMSEKAEYFSFDIPYEFFDTEHKDYDFQEYIPELSKYFMYKTEQPEMFAEYIPDARTNVSLVYRSDRNSGEILASLPNVFRVWKFSSMQNLSFYRKGISFFTSKMYEETAEIFSCTDEDIRFLTNNDILFHQCNSISSEIFPIPSLPMKAEGE